MIDQALLPETGRVLLIEHDAGDARLITSALSEVTPFDFEIDFATGLADAVALLEAGRFDVVLLDMDLPDTGQEEAVDTLRPLLAGGALIVLTPLGREGAALELVSRGVNDYVIKGTLRKAELGRSIRYALERQQLVREASVREERLQAAIAAQKTWVVGRLAASVAHEFSNLLTGLMGEAELLRRTVAPCDSRASIAESMAEGLERAAVLSRQLVSFSRQRPSDDQIVDLNLIISGLQPMLESLLGSRIRLIIDCGRQPARVKGDPAQLEQLLLNLVANARDAMEGDGTVTIATSLVRRRAGRYALLTVKDDGQGMEGHTVARVFEPFFTTRHESGRAGLGLAAVSHIVEHSSGEVDVDSTLGEGTEFRILLPVEEEDQLDARSEISGPWPAVHEGPARVLVVEDSEPVRRLLQQALVDVGYEVLVAADGSEALAAARGLDGPLNMLVTDVVLPHLNGRDLSDELKRLFPMMQTLFISGYDEGILAPEGMLEAGVNFLPKPFHLREVVRLVRRTIGDPPFAG
jgi:two-component system, cell cycle sensor histidine kinase and response regulator CckA